VTIFNGTVASLLCAWLWMGYSMLRLEEYGFTELCSLKALELDPGNACARNLLGRALYRQRRYSEAAVEHLAASRMETDNRLFREEYARASYFSGSYEEAFEGFGRAGRFCARARDSSLKSGQPSPKQNPRTCSTPPRISCSTRILRTAWAGSGTNEKRDSRPTLARRLISASR